MPAMKIRMWIASQSHENEARVKLLMLYLKKMVTMQEKNDEMMFKLEEKRTRMEEKQMELNAQLKREERDFQLKLMQMMMNHGNPPVPDALCV